MLRTSHYVKMATRDRLARNKKQGATSVVNFGWQISITKPMFISEWNFGRRQML
jgi:hypothetical protein